MENQADLNSQAIQPPKASSSLSLPRTVVLPLILAEGVLGIVIAGAAYYWGTQTATKNQQTSYQAELRINSPSPSVSEVFEISPTSNSAAESTATESVQVSSSSKAVKYIKYEFKQFHIGTKIFQLEVPSDWTAATSNWNTPTISLGKAQELEKGVLQDFTSTVDIRMRKDAKLAHADPSTWPSEDQLAFFDESAVSNESVNVRVNGLPAKKYSVETVGSPKEVILLVKDDVVFTFINNGNEEDQKYFDHVLSTFKTLDFSTL